MNGYRKAFCDIKNYRHVYVPDVKNFRHISEPEIANVRKNLIKWKKSLKFKKFRGNIDSVDYEDLDKYDDNYDLADDDNTEKFGVLEHYLKRLIEIITNE